MKINISKQDVIGGLITFAIVATIMFATVFCTSCGDSRAYSGSGQRLISQEAHDDSVRANYANDVHTIAMDVNGETMPLFPVKVLGRCGVVRILWCTRVERAMFKAGDLVYAVLDDYDGKWVVATEMEREYSVMTISAVQPESE